MDTGRLGSAQYEGLETGDLTKIQRQTEEGERDTAMKTGHSIKPGRKKRGRGGEGMEMVGVEEADHVCVPSSVSLAPMLC